MSDFFATKSGATIYSTLDVPSLRIPPSFIASRYTCIYSSCVSFNENWSLLRTLAQLTCRSFCERFLRDKKWRHNLCNAWHSFAPNTAKRFFSRITCIYSSCVSFNENWPLLATLAPLTCCPFWVQIGATIHATLDVPSLRIPPNVIVSRYTCFNSSCVIFNENWPLLTTLVPLTRRPFCEQFLRDKKWRHNLYAMLDIPSLRMLPNVFVSRITCIYSSCLSFNENRILLTTVAICTSRPFLEQLGENV